MVILIITLIALNLIIFWQARTINNLYNKLDMLHSEVDKFYLYYIKIHLRYDKLLGENKYLKKLIDGVEQNVV